jgi:predicted RNA-binding protein with PUA-like domain
MKYWLFKSEPETFSLNDLKKSKNQITYWDGVRNYQARNYIRDEMKLGDRILFYHSSTVTPVVVGLCKIVKEAYPDFTAFDTKNIHYDPKSKKDNPTWYMVDIKFEKEFSKTVTLTMIKEDQKLKNMKLIQKGNRLSVMPVTKEEFDEIVRLGTGN